MRKIIYILLSIIFMVLFFTFCFSSSFRDSSNDFFGSWSRLINVIYAFSFIISLGVFLKAYNRPFTDVLLGGGSTWGKRESSQYQNIHAFMKYRNGLMGGMSPENSARLMLDTSVADAIINGTYSGAETEKTANYINGMLGGISPKNQINFLKGMGN